PRRCTCRPRPPPPRSTLFPYTTLFRSTGRAEHTEGTAREVLQTTAQIAKDPTLVSDAQQRVREEQITPERAVWEAAGAVASQFEDRKSTRLNSSHVSISYAVFCLKKKK